MNYEEACKKAGYVRSNNAPQSIVRYYAYKDGKAHDCPNREDAAKISKNIEPYTVNKADIDAYWKQQRELEAKASKIFHEALRKEYDHLNDEVYSILYSEAYEDGHACGYDEVASKLSTLVDLMERVMKVYPK